MTKQNQTLQASINELYDTAAASYEAEHGHGIQQDDAALWSEIFAPFIQTDKETNVLDVGSGTGVLTRLIAGMGAHVTGLEPSAEMIAQARDLDKREGRRNTSHVQGDVHDSDLFSSESFDLITSRQAVCYLRDPLVAFTNLRRWLRPAGTVLLIDGLWTRAGWGNSDLIDRLPLSCLQTTATLPYLLEKAGFQVMCVTLLHKINQRLVMDGDCSPRYLVHVSPKPGF